MDARLPPQGATSSSRPRPTPQWGGDLDQIDFDDIHYFVRASEKNSRDWDDVPEDIKNTFDKLGIPEAERKFLAGVGAQYESEVVYHQLREDLEKQGVIFIDMDTGAPRAPGPRPRVLRHGHPAQRQQVRRAQLGGLVGRLVRLRPGRREGRRSRCRPTSGSTPRTWASSSGR